MAAGDVHASGAFGIDDTTGIDAYLTSQNMLSGGNLVSWQDKENVGVWFACVEGGT